MQKTLLAFLLLALAAYSAACLALFLLQRSPIYFLPAQAAIGAPAISTMDLPGARIVVSDRPRAGAGGTPVPLFPVRRLLRDRYESTDYALLVKAPTLVISAGRDEIVPAHSTARHAVIDRAGHNAISGSAAYTAALRWARSALPLMHCQFHIDGPNSCCPSTVSPKRLFPDCMN